MYICLRIVKTKYFEINCLPYFETKLFVTIVHHIMQYLNTPLLEYRIYRTLVLEILA